MNIDLRPGETLNSRMTRRGFTSIRVLFLVSSGWGMTPLPREWGTVYEKAGRYWRTARLQDLVRHPNRFEMHEVMPDEFEVVPTEAVEV